MVFNTTAAEVIDRSLEVNTHAAVFKQTLYGGIGILLGIFLYFWGYERLLQMGYPLLVLGSVLLILTFIPGIGVKINGARRWIGIGGSPIGQPSECIKLFLPVAYIQWFLQKKQNIDLRSFFTMLLWSFPPIFLVLIEPDSGTALLLFALLVVLFWLSKIRLSYWAFPLIVLLAIGSVAAYQMPHVQRRVQVYLHPELDLKGKGHQPYQAKIAAGSGGAFGRGFGQSLQKLNYLPEARSDYIAAIFAEEMGFLGIFFLITLYIILGSSGFLIAMQAREKGAFLLSSILTFLISIQAFINLGVVSALLPSKGMTLPFFSQGGSSLLMNIASFFILLDIARKQKWKTLKNPP